MKNYKIAVAGTGYVGLSLGVLFAQHHQVVAVDIVQAKVDMINNKKSPIQDDYIEKYLAENYNMIDGCVNNVPKKPRVIGGRVSVLDRLHIKQAERARKDNAQVQQQERTRKT